MHQVYGALTAAPPFDFKKSLDFIENFPITHGEQFVADGVLTRVMQLDGQMLVYRLTSSGSVTHPTLDYSLHSDHPIGGQTAAAAADHIAFFLSLSDDLTPFYEIGRRDPAFAPVIERLYGYHQVKFPRPFENAVWAILSQRNTMSLSEKMKQAMTERYGGRMELDGSLYRAFPEPAQLAGGHVDELAAVIRHGPKAESILDAAHHFASIDEAFLREADYDDVYRWLRQIRGIGDWSATFILLRGLGRMEHLPRGEKRVLDAASRVYKQPMTQEALERLGEHYGLWKGYWAHYLRVAN